MAASSHARPLILIGASTRAAAQSARRAGFHPYCVDQFADEDLRACATVLPCDRFPADLPSTLAAAPHAEWLYTGGLENQPDLVAQLAEIRPLLGNHAQALRLVRDPFWLADVLRSHQHPALAVRSLTDMYDTPDTSHRRWLSKPLRSAGGRGITVFDANTVSRIPEQPATHYLQEFVSGLPISGLFVTDGQRTLCCGLARQLVGASFPQVPPFGYAGSIAPLDDDDLPASTRQQVAALGTLIATQAGLCGLFGIDCIWDAVRSVAWLLEVNPRYTATVELFEQATGVALLARHHRVTSSQSTAKYEDWFFPLPRATQRCGKLVLYAGSSLIAPELRDNPSIADIPTPGSEIAGGMPICTVFARGTSTEECLVNLNVEARRTGLPLS